MIVMMGLPQGSPMVQASIVRPIPEPRGVAVTQARMFTTRPEIQGTFGVAATTHWLATAVAMRMLERGGNAFDAGVAAAFTLQVVEPHLNGPGGDVPVMVLPAATGKAEVVCGQGTAPAGATIAHYRDKLGLDLVPGTGLLAACIPGTFPTWMLVLERYGTMRLADVLEPAIGYARNGYPVVHQINETIGTVAGLFKEHWPTSAAVYLPGGKAPAPGTLFRNEAHAATYERILREAQAGGGSREAEIDRARRAWSQGFVAEAMGRFCREQEIMDVSGRRNRGVLTADDIARWQPTIEAPLSYDYGRYRVLKPGPWSQSPVLLQQLALLKGYDLAKLSPTDPDAMHIWIETAKLAFADREAFYGDPDHTDIPMTELLSDAYNDKRRALIDHDRASLELRPGTAGGRTGVVATRLASGRAPAAGVGEPTVRRDTAGVGEPTVRRDGLTRGDTCHIDIVDRDGNMLTATPSGGWLQSSPVIPELGFPLGSRAQMFWLDERSSSALAPGHRPRTTLSVGMTLRDGEPYMAWGTPGGDQQDQWNSQLFLRHVHWGMNLQEAIDAPSWHIEHFPNSFWPREARPGVVVIEARMPEPTIAELRRRGHVVEVGPNWSEGRLSAVARDGKLMKAAANPRGMQGYAAGR
jgi:gamma-glutamyltranspeptidase/glutathione hydrolase